MKHNFEALTTFLSGLITLPRFIYTEVRSLSVTDCKRDCGWLIGLRPRTVDSRLRQQPKVQRSVTGTFVRYTSRRNAAVAVIITRNTPQV